MKYCLPTDRVKEDLLRVEHRNKTITNKRKLVEFCHSKKMSIKVMIWWLMLRFSTIVILWVLEKFCLTYFFDSFTGSWLNDSFVTAFQRCRKQTENLIFILIFLKFCSRSKTVWHLIACSYVKFLCWCVDLDRGVLCLSALDLNKLLKFTVIMFGILLLTKN